MPQHRRAGMPGFKKKREAAPTLNYTQRGFSLCGGRLVMLVRAGFVPAGVEGTRPDRPLDGQAA